MPVKAKPPVAQIFQLGVGFWLIGISSPKVKILDPQALESWQRCDSGQVHYHVVFDPTVVINQLAEGFYFKCYVVNCYKLLLQTKVEDENKQLKNQLQSMTEQLNQSETVQRDFVRLSQSLQVHVNKMN